MYYLALVLSLAVTWQALGQAPGDFDPSCREGTNAENKNFPPDTEVLLDTTDYTFLFEGINFVWVERDFDSDDTNNVRKSPLLPFPIHQLLESVRSCDSQCFTV